MTNHELHRKMEFIVEQQEQTKSEKRISRLEGAIVSVVNLVRI